PEAAQQHPPSALELTQEEGLAGKMVSLGGEGAFPPGSTVHFKTALGASLQAQVVCFDPALKVLAVRDTSSGKPILRMFNIALISEIREISGPANGDSLETMFSPSSMSNQQVADRSAVAENRRCVEAMETDVTLDGQRAFIQLRRTLDDVRWRGEEISVLERVVVRPPYTPESAVAIQEGDSQSQSALMHVRKILSKPFIPEQKLTACCVAPEGNGGV
uniref:AD domain-containing protein n=1 Tax=Haemonchus contortus TaxID=6289 RepID=A0A7I4YBJ2_HAECO